jgi:hypothetical protein
MNQLPFSSNINNNALASILNYTSATYKFYWFLGIIEEVEAGKQKIPKVNIFSQMVAFSWCPINFFRLSFGTQDHLDEISDYFKSTLSLFDNTDTKKIYKAIVNDERDKSLKVLYHLNKNVPHKFLSPWYKGTPRNIREKSQNDTHDVIYRLYEKEVVINDNWYNYIRKNTKVLKHFIRWNLANFVQARNPSTPNVLNKLIKPAKRSPLTKTTQKILECLFKTKTRH